MRSNANEPVIPVKEFFTLDLRALAFFRIALATFIFLDWIDRLPDIRTHYSDAGIIPRDVITGINPFSVHMMHGSVWFQSILFAIAIFFSLLLLVGWRTPWVALINWFFLVSIHSRNPALMQGGDHLLRAITFWSIFLPLGAYWSVDASREGDRPTSTRVLSPASVAYVLQMCVIYWFAAGWKWLGPWREEGTAVYLTLHIDHFPTRLGLIVREMPTLCWYLTHATVWLETLGPVLLLLPFHVGLQRLIVVAMFILFHAGLALCMELGHFPFVCMVAWLPLIPPSFWDRLEGQLRSPDAPRWTIVYDADRRRGKRCLAWLRTFLFLGEAKLVVAGEEGGQLARVRQQGGWGIIDQEGQEIWGSEALRQLVQMSPVWFPCERWLRGRFGGWLARSMVGSVGHAKRSEPGGTPAWMPPRGLMANTLVIFCLCYIIFCNVFGFAGSKLRDLFPDLAKRWLPLVPDQVGQLAASTGLEQGWGLFAPEPGRQAGWFVLVGKQKDGQEVDAIRGGAMNWDKPEFQTLTYQSGRWRKFIMNLSAIGSYPYLLPGYTRFYFNEWNRHHEGQEQLISVEAYYMREITVPPWETPPPVERLFLGRYEMKPATEPPGWLLVVGTRRTGGKMIDLMRGGVDAEWRRPDPLVDPPIVHPLFGLVGNVAISEMREDVLSGLTQFLLKDWNNRFKDKPEEQLRQIQVLRIRETSSGQLKREVLAEANLP
jgi:hypothetical protein